MRAALPPSFPLRRPRRGFFTVAALVAALLGCGMGGSGEKKAPLARDPSAQSAPLFSLQDLTGKTVSLSDLKGNVVLVDFWATWCPPCRTSIPAIEKLHAEYGPKGLKVLGISLDEDVDAVAAFAREQGMGYPVLLGASSDVADRYQVRGIPTMYLLDKQGRVVRRWIGFDPRLPREWRAAIEPLLAA